MNICVIGTGYVGLVTGTCLATWHKVTCFDTDKDKIACLNKGKIPIYEQGLENLIKMNVAAGRLSFSAIPQVCLPKADVIFVCTGTPTTVGGKCDLSQVKSALSEICDQCVDSKVVVVKSTVPPASSLKLWRILDGKGVKHHYMSNPEFLREGTAVHDFLNASRIVIGCGTAVGKNKLTEVYAEHPGEKIYTSVSTAETAKYICNCALATKISFINEASNICEHTGADMNEIREIMALDPRIGDKFYQQGPGYGGSCFPKDVDALIEYAVNEGYDPTLLKSVRGVNIKQKKRLFWKLLRAIPDKITAHNARVALWGAAFKPGTDDLRESPAVAFIQDALSAGVFLQVHDPKAISNLRARFGSQLDYFDGDPMKAIEGVDALVTATAWPEYKSIPLVDMPTIPIIDGANIYTHTDALQCGIHYVGFGT